MEDPAFYKRILNSMRDMVLVKGPQSKLLWANKSFLDYYGMTVDELKGIVDAPQSDPDDTLQYVRDDKYVFDTQSDLNIPSEPVTNSAEQVNYFHSVKSPIFVDNEMIQSVGVSRLIEDQTIQQQNLTELDAKVFTAPLRSIIDSYPIATMLLDHDLRIIKCNKRWSDLFGSAPSVSNMNFADHYTDLADLLGSSQTSLSKRMEIDTVLQIAMSTSEKYFDFKTSPWSYPNETIGGVLIVATDVTSIMQNEENLRRTQRAQEALNRRLLLALEASEVGVWEWDLTTDNLIWDQQMYVLYGIEEKNFDGAYTAWENGLHPEDKERSVAEIGDAASETGKFDTEFRVIWPSGEVRNIRALADAIEDDSGKVVKMIGVNWDITKEKVHENRLRKANDDLCVVNEELAQFSYRTSHDLKAPLTTSKRLAEFTLQDIEDGDLEEAKLNTVKIFRQMEGLEGLVSDILSLAEADFREPSDQPVNFQEIIRAIMEKLSWMDEGGAFSVRKAISASREFRGDKIRLSQALENLVSNAIKYRDTEKTEQFVSIKIFDEEAFLKITVEDNGIGIPEDYQGDLFKMFKRFHPKVAAGSGLGLSIVKKNIDRMGGTIDVRSSGAGTCFSICIPAELTNE